jgi:hypothetical protein
MRRLAAVPFLLLALADCGGGSATGPSGGPYPAVAGTYALTATFNGLPSAVAHVTGTVTLSQASRSSSAVGGAANLAVFISPNTFTETSVTGIILTTDGKISFHLGSASAPTTWTFDGTIAGKTMSGTHTLSNGAQSFSGPWTASLP